MPIENAQPPELNYARSLARATRWLAWLAVAMMAFWCVQRYQVREATAAPWLFWLTLPYCCLISAWMLFPWVKARSSRLWRTGMIGICILSFFFVFLLIGNVMVDAMAAAEVGEKLGVPGFEGTLMFLALSQIPAMLFERHPEMMV